MEKRETYLYSTNICYDIPKNCAAMRQIYKMTKVGLNIYNTNILRESAALVMKNVHFNLKVNIDNHSNWLKIKTKNCDFVVLSFFLFSKLIA